MKHQESLLKKIISGIGLKLKIPEHYQFLGFAYSVCLTYFHSFPVCKTGIISTFLAKYSSVKKALQWTNLPNVSQEQQRSPVCSIHQSRLYKRDHRSYSGCHTNRTHWQHSNEVRVKFTLQLTERGKVLLYVMKTKMYFSSFQFQNHTDT